MVNNVPCVADSDGVGVNFTITGQMIGFVTLEIKDSQTDEHLQDINIGIIRPPEQLLDDVSKKIDSQQSQIRSSQT